jgi:formamidopyrimidine-DNA glycosylase
VPELPEVETARSLIADRALHRHISAVDDADAFVCRPHSPGQLRDALTGRMFTAARRRGKTMWCETSGDSATGSGPDLGIHLGMGGRIIVTGWDGQTAEAAALGTAMRSRTRPSGTASRWSSPTAAAWCCSTSAGSAASG